MEHPRSRWYWIGLALLAVAAIGYAHQRDLYALHLDYRSSDDEVRMLERHLEQSVASEARLQEKVDELHDDPLELEAAIRATKRLVREGETIYRVPLPESTSKQTEPGVTANSRPAGAHPETSGQQSTTQAVP